MVITSFKIRFDDVNFLAELLNDQIELQIESLSNRLSRLHVSKFEQHLQSVLGIDQGRKTLVHKNLGLLLQFLHLAAKPAHDRVPALVVVLIEGVVLGRPNGHNHLADSLHDAVYASRVVDYRLQVLAKDIVEVTQDTGYLV